MGYTIANTGAVLFKAGRNVQTSGGSLITSAAMMMQALSGAESFVNVSSRYNWIDNYSTLDPDVKNLVSDAVASLAAIDLINFDMSGYTSRQEALTMINILWGKYQDIMDLLKDKKYTDFMKGGS